MIKSRKDVIRILKDNNYFLVSIGKHEKWSNGDNSLFIPKKHKSFHKIGHKEILKKANLI